jgi:hypothetical protein
MNMQTDFSYEDYHDVNGVDLCPDLWVLQQTVSGIMSVWGREGAPNDISVKKIIISIRAAGRRNVPSGTYTL